ncbi:unnamed protein product [Ilex paraguariensis]|uniref:Cation/H+ exchanger domain-containing protein n=1 Tax=Ilex paraguariensis TaxID=185542 RepID=A0ABC8S7P5_9AQUA
MENSISLPVVNAASFGKDLRGPEYCKVFEAKVIYNGVFSNDHITQFVLPPLLLQLGLVTFFSGVLHFILKPLRQPKYVADILSGIILGPSVLGRSKAFNETLFPPKGMMVLDVYEMVGIILFTFLIGVRTDVHIVRKAGGLAIAIGLASFLLPVIITEITAKILRATITMDKKLHDSIALVGFHESMINYHAAFCILKDLKLVNSELGRVALSSSMISGLCSWIYLLIYRITLEAQHGRTIVVLAAPASRLFMLIVILFAIRPFMYWIIRHTPEGKTLKESYVCGVTLVVFGIALFSQVTGVHPIFTSIVLGLTVPDGSPLASGLVDKLESFVSAVLLPSFFANVGQKVDVKHMTLRTFGIVVLFIALALLGKIIGCMVASLYWNMHLMDALLLLTEETLSIMVIMAILNAAAVTLLLRSLYNPSRRHVTYKRRTIQENRLNAEFRILACIFQEDNVPIIINILEASNPCRESPIGVYVLDLVELVGRAMPLFITHKLNRNPSNKSTRSHRIIRAFCQYEGRNEGLVNLQCFTSIAPYATIYSDICAVALEKSISLVIIPFHKANGHSIRAVNKSVLENAPCSVGILVDQRMVENSKARHRSWFTFHVCVIFIGGPDDRETLVYGARMAEHPGIRLTIIRITALNNDTNDINADRELDFNAVNKFKDDTMDNNRVVYKEEGVTEGSGTTRVLQSLNNNSYDIVLVGRRHDAESSIMSGLAAWSEIVELGVIGDILSSSDLKGNAAVLVVQQQALLAEDMLQSHIDTDKDPTHSSSIAASHPVDSEKWKF